MARVIFYVFLPRCYLYMILSCQYALDCYENSCFLGHSLFSFLVFVWGLSPYVKSVSQCPLALWGISSVFVAKTAVVQFSAFYTIYEKIFVLFAQSKVCNPTKYEK